MCKLTNEVMTIWRVFSSYIKIDLIYTSTETVLVCVKDRRCYLSQPFSPQRTTPRLLRKDHIFAFAGPDPILENSHHSDYFIEGGMNLRSHPNMLERGMHISRSMELDEYGDFSTHVTMLESE